jgi:hypothetical protein
MVIVDGGVLPGKSAGRQVCGLYAGRTGVRGVEGVIVMRLISWHGGCYWL